MAAYEAMADEQLNLIIRCMTIYADTRIENQINRTDSLISSALDSPNQRYTEVSLGLSPEQEIDLSKT